MACEFCDSTGGMVLWQNELCRVVAVDDPGYPGFCRVILNRHEREMTDLSLTERYRVMAVVFAVESHLRLEMQPDKMNLASLGNMTPHLHWHVIPRYRDDRHFPGPVWAAPRHEAPAPVERVRRAGNLPASLPVALGALAG